MRYKITSFDHLKLSLSELSDDQSKQWNEYPCLLWDRATSGGYGALCVRKKSGLHAQRVAYEIAYGPIPPGIVICHHCDNPRCFRPIHLFAGTQLDNMRDCKSKGRRVTLSGPNHWMAQRGIVRKVRSRSGLHGKLTPEQVRWIKSVLPSMGNTEISKQVGVTDSAISYIRSGKTWKHVAP